MLQHLPFIMRNTLRNKRRSLLTLCSIAVSLCLLGVVIAFYMALFEPTSQSPSQARRVIVHHKVSLTQALPASYRQKIEAVPGVEAISDWQWYGGTYKDARNASNFFARLCVDPDTIFKVRPDLKIAPEQLAAFEETRSSCVASANLAKRMHWQLGERIVLTGDIFPGTLDMKLVGIFDSPESDEALFLPWKLVQEGFPASQQGWIGAYVVLVDTPGHVAGVSRAIDAMFANSPAPTKTETEMDFAVSFVSFLGNLKLFLGAIAGAVTFTILLVCANTVAMAVRERTRETAILRTLGYTPAQVTGFILGEAGLLGLVGGLAGALLADGLCVGLNQTHMMGFPMPLLTLPLTGVVVLAGTAIGMCAAVVPAVVAGRRSVLESLRYVG